MEKDNVAYQNQGIHVICSIFTVEKGKTKVLLIKRKNNPYNGMWALVGGALYNYEDIETGLRREIKEKTGIEGIRFVQSGVFSDPNRSPVMRMVAISYIGFVDFNKVQYLKDTLKTSDARLFDIDEIPELAYDHKDILNVAIITLKEKILSSDILEDFYPNGVSLPELQILYETILGEKIDKRNFRKKLISDEIIYETGNTTKFNGNKPAMIYKINTKKRGKVL